MSLKIRRNCCLRDATGIFFVLLSALASVNFDVCSIDFVMLLLNDVPFSIFVSTSIQRRLFRYQTQSSAIVWRQNHICAMLLSLQVVSYSFNYGVSAYYGS